MNGWILLGVVAAVGFLFYWKKSVDTRLKNLEMFEQYGYGSASAK